MTESRRMAAYLIADRLALQRLVEQPECEAGEQNLLLTGYEAYMIEQWATERRLNTVVSSYTGNQSDSILVSTLLVPEQRSEWGGLVTQYFDELSRLHLVPKETSAGRIFVTNLSSFPSNWTLIAMPRTFEEGRELFIVNENLKRLHCVGRLAVTLDRPSDAAASKFRQLLKIPQEVPLLFAVREVITLTQIAFFYFDLLPAEYVDGLFCDHTLRAAHQWWAKFGAPRFKYTPARTSNLYEALTVAGVVGFVVGVRGRLSQLGIKVPKDPFNADHFVHCIRQFQKAQRLPLSMRLDEQTVWRLFEATARNVRASGPDMFTVFKAAMKEGIRGVATSDPMREFETSELDVLVLNVKGNRAQYLWQYRGHRYIPQQVMSGAGVTAVQHSPATGIPLCSLAENEKSSRQQKQQSIVVRFRRKQVPPTQLKRPQTERPQPTIVLDASASSSDEDSDDEDPKIMRERRGTGSASGSGHERSSSATSSSHGGASAAARAELIKWERRVLTKDDLSVGASEPVGTRLRRTVSFGEVERIVFPWTFPVAVPKVVKLYSRARELKKLLEQQMWEESQFCETLSRTVQSQMMKLNAEQRNSEVIKFQVSASSRREQAVKVQIRELEAVTAKLDYEYSFLDEKLRDVEASIDTFAEKVEHIEQRWIAVQKRPETVLERLGVLLGLA